MITLAPPQPFDRRDDLATLLPTIDYLLPNDDEARCSPEHDPLDQAAALQAAGATTAIVTCGVRGAVAARGRQRWRCGAYACRSSIPPDAATPSPPASSRASFAAGACGSTRYASALGASAVRAVGTTDGVFRGDEAEAFVAEHPLGVEEWLAD